jgi:predicted Zn-dependent protease
MDAPTRLQSLLQLWEQEPEDPFLAYAVATEYRKTDRALARAMYEQLVADHPDYTATYYHLASLYRELGEPDLAVDTYVRGVAACLRVGDRHALAELRRAQQDLADDLDE